MNRRRNNKENRLVVSAPVQCLFTRIREFLYDPPFLLQCCILWLYRIVLDVIYIRIISPIYLYDGLETKIVPSMYIASILAILVFSPLIVKIQDGKRPSDFLISFINYLYFIPLTSYCGCKGASGSFFVIAVTYWGVLLGLQMKVPTIVVADSNMKYKKWLFLFMSCAASTFVMYISGKYTHFRLTLDIYDVYGIRQEAAGYDMSTIAAYVLSMMAVVLTILLLYWLTQKNYLMAILICVVFLFLFSIAAHKTQIFLLLIALGAFFFFQDWMIPWVGGALILLSGVASAEYLIRGSCYILSFFLRRLMILPAYLSELYYMFFLDNPLNLFRDGIMGKLSFRSIYPIDLAYLLGESEGKVTAANNGLLGDMFANLPIPVGLVIMPLIIVMCTRLLDMVACQKSKKLVVIFSLYFAISFINTSWSTVLLSHGFFVTCILLYFWPREEGEIL